MTKYYPITRRQVTACRDCQVEITFRKNVHGTWYPVEVTYLPDGRPAYSTHGHFTPWHTCQQPTRISPPGDVGAELYAESMLSIWDAALTGRHLL